MTFLSQSLITCGKLFLMKQSIIKYVPVINVLFKFLPQSNIWSKVHIFSIKKCVDNECTNFKAHDFTIFLQLDLDEFHTKQEGHIQQYLLNSYATRVIILTLNLCAGGLPTKRERAVKRHIGVRNHANAYKINLKGQSTHNYFFNLRKKIFS